MDYKSLPQIDKSIDQLEKIESLIEKRYHDCEVTQYGSTHDFLECSVKFTVHHQGNIFFKLDYKTDYDIQDIFCDTLINAIRKEIRRLRNQKASILGIGKRSWKRLFI